MGIINMTSLIFFGTIIILLGIIIVCFYNKSFEINEGFRRNRNPPPKPKRIIAEKPVYYPNGWKNIPYPPQDIAGWVTERRGFTTYYVLYG
jgi:hypothetical protein